MKGSLSALGTNQSQDVTVTRNFCGAVHEQCKHNGMIEFIILCFIIGLLILHPLVTLKFAGITVLGMAFLLTLFLSLFALQSVVLLIFRLYTITIIENLLEEKDFKKLRYYSLYEKAFRTYKVSNISMTKLVEYETLPQRKQRLREERENQLQYIDSQ